MYLAPSRILITDDHVPTRTAMGELLADPNYQLSFAASGPECLAKAAELRPDLILLDVRMPEMDGFEVCRRLRADPTLAVVPIVLVTALEDRAARLQGLEAGADDFLTKPVDTIELQARVRTITRLNRYRRMLEAQAKFQQLVEHTTDGVTLCDEAGRLIEWNASQERITSLSRAQALGRLAWEVQYELQPKEKRLPEELARIEAIMRTLLREGQSSWLNQLADHEIQGPDGVRRLVQSRAFLIPTEKGWRLGSISRDLTEHRQLEMALHAKERLWERTMHSLLDAVFIVSADTTQILDCNSAAEDLFRYTRAELLSRPTDFLHVDEAALAEFRRHLYTAVEKQGFLHELEFQMKRKDGTIFPTAHSVTPIEDDQGRRIAWVSVVHDLTARKAGEAALRESERSLKRSQQIAHVGHWTWDTRANRVQWSDEMQRIFGVDPQTFDGQLDELIRRTIHPDDRDRVFQLTAAVIREGRPLETEYRVVWPDGSIRHIWLLPGDRETDAQGNILRLSGIVQDITERVRSEQERQQAEALKQSHAQALMQLEVLRQVDQLRTELIANVSHEIRTPLGLILGMATALRRDALPLSEDTREGFLQDIEEEAYRLRAIVESLFDAERLQAGRVILSRQLTNVRLLIDQAVKTASRQAAGHPLVQEIPADLPMVAVDANRLEQVLRNLLDNAVKYSPAGSTITLQAATAAGQFRLTVHDEGPGIPPGEQERIFERFYRLTGQNPPAVPGLGLGLAICRGIVEAHGGRLWVESDGIPGHGSTFTLTLPAEIQPTGDRPQ